MSFIGWQDKKLYLFDLEGRQVFRVWKSPVLDPESLIDHALLGEDEALLLLHARARLTVYSLARERCTWSAKDAACLLRGEVQELQMAFHRVQVCRERSLLLALGESGQVYLLDFQLRVLHFIDRQLQLREFRENSASCYQFHREFAPQIRADSLIALSQARQFLVVPLEGLPEKRPLTPGRPTFQYPDSVETHYPSTSCSLGGAFVTGGLEGDLFVWDRNFCYVQ